MTNNVHQLRACHHRCCSVILTLEVFAAALVLLKYRDTVGFRCDGPGTTNKIPTDISTASDSYLGTAKTPFQHATTTLDSKVFGVVPENPRIPTQRSPCGFQNDRAAPVLATMGAADIAESTYSGVQAGLFMPDHALERHKNCGRIDL
jgi:hypothetical protein